MGRTVCAAVLAANDMELVAAVDPAAADVPVVELIDAAADAGSVGAAEHVRVSASLDALAGAQVEVAVDFTVLESARSNLTRLAADGIHAVVGTTGFTDEDLATFAHAFERSNCVIAPNFAISAVLMMRFASWLRPCSTAPKWSSCITMPRWTPRRAPP